MDTVVTTTFAELWHQVFSSQPAPPYWLTLASGIAALAATVHRPTWRISRNVATIAHEGGHALAAVTTGRRLTGIRLHSDTSGVTVSKGKPRGPGMVVTAAAGYVTPPLLGVGGAWLLSTGHITALLWTVVALLAAMLLVIRNVYGVVAVVVTGGGVLLVSWLAAAIAQAAFAYAFAWFLLLTGIRPVVELQRKRRRGRAPNSDADQLGRLTGVPPIAWVGVFGIVAVAALVIGARWLLPPVPPLLP